MQTQREGEGGQSYFYVLWPEERVTALGSSRSQGIMPQMSHCTENMASDSAGPGNPAQQVVIAADDSSEQGSGGSSSGASLEGRAARDLDSARAATGKLFACSSLEV